MLMYSLREKQHVSSVGHSLRNMSLALSVEISDSKNCGKTWYH